MFLTEGDKISWADGDTQSPAPIAQAPTCNTASHMGANVNVSNITSNINSNSNENINNNSDSYINLRNIIILVFLIFGSAAFGFATAKFLGTGPAQHTPKVHVLNGLSSIASTLKNGVAQISTIGDFLEEDKLTRNPKLAGHEAMLERINLLKNAMGACNQPIYHINQSWISFNYDIALAQVTDIKAIKDSHWPFVPRLLQFTSDSLTVKEKEMVCTMNNRIKIEIEDFIASIRILDLRIQAVHAYSDQLIQDMRLYIFKPLPAWYWNPVAVYTLLKDELKLSIRQQRNNMNQVKHELNDAANVIQGYNDGLLKQRRHTMGYSLSWDCGDAWAQEGGAHKVLRTNAENAITNIVDGALNWHREVSKPAI
ncbi:hypothetical protein K505DRAFT_358480 [Melanomma pulvis-pyrius CBS 109.77]|uniref:Uncharacterized protein n=1 Tax=Melanomma pulvis-pyrius CBS 109.77 TaxID=1314802 RepID=A0A6A6XN39_9PLEO|nr:hypothetical protein K505DRAFT_358480 [Melanomma pulvis-pyrius CBS 109.77]